MLNEQSPWHIWNWNVQKLRKVSCLDIILGTYYLQILDTKPEKVDFIPWNRLHQCLKLWFTLKQVQGDCGHL